MSLGGQKLLNRLLPSVKVFARVSPKQKVMIIMITIIIIIVIMFLIFVGINYKCVQGMWFLHFNVWRWH